MLVAFVLIERRSRAPLIPLDYFRRRNFAFPIGVQFFSLRGLETLLSEFWCIWLPCVLAMLASLVLRRKVLPRPS